MKHTDGSESPVEIVDIVDIVADASMDSFPASDPPSWSGMRAGPPRATSTPGATDGTTVASGKIGVTAPMIGEKGQTR